MRCDLWRACRCDLWRFCACHPGTRQKSHISSVLTARKRARELLDVVSFGPVLVRNSTLIHSCYPRCYAPNPHFHSTVKRRRRTMARPQGSIPSGRTPGSPEQNQPLTTPTPGHPSGAWSGLGPEPASHRTPRVEDWVEVRTGANFDPPKWIGGRVTAEFTRGGVPMMEVTLPTTDAPRAGLIDVIVDSEGVWWRWPLVICPGCGEKVPGVDANWGLCGRCGDERRERERLADPSVTHGKGGVPPLPAVDDPVDMCPCGRGRSTHCTCDCPSEIPVRRCVGGPGCDCDAILGPEVKGSLCDHCTNYAAAIRSQEDDVSEVVRAAKRDGAAAADVRDIALRTLASIGYLDADDVEPIRMHLDGLAKSIGAAANQLSGRGTEVLLSLHSDFLSTLVASRARAVGRG